MPTHVTIVVQNIDKAMAFEWIARHVDDHRYRLSFIFLGHGGKGQSAREIEAMGLPVIAHRFRGKADAARLVWQLARDFRRLGTEVVHAHFTETSLIAFLAAKIAGVGRRITHRHHSDYYHEYVPRMVRADRWVNRLATDIVAITGMVRSILVEREGADAGKIQVIPHGFEVDKFQHPDPAAVDQLAEAYGTKGHYPVIGCIARYDHWKGHRYIIEAFSALLKDYPEAKLLLAGAGGPAEKEIRALLQKLPEASFTEIDFEPNLFALYALMDQVWHAPIDRYKEAFGQVYIEAMAAGVPSVVTLSGVAPDVVADRRNAMVVPHRDSQAILAAAHELLADPTLRERIRQRGVASVRPAYELHPFIRSLEALYGL